MADWKKIPKIDAHIHLLPQDVIDANKEYNALKMVGWLDK